MVFSLGSGRNHLGGASKDMFTDLWDEVGSELDLNVEFERDGATEDT